MDRARGQHTGRFLNGRFAGVYLLAPNFAGPCGHIANGGDVVVKSMRRRGVGRAMLGHSIGDARQLGFDVLMFNLVMESNPSRLLYKNAGFVQIGRIPNAIGDEAALIYWRSLD